MPEEGLEQDYRRIWRTVGFIEADISKVAADYERWMEKVFSPVDIALTKTEILGSIDAVLLHVAPVRRGPTSRSVFVPCRNGWTALFENGRSGADPSPIRVLSKHLECRSMRVTSTLNDPVTSQFGAVLWSVFSDGESVRSIAAANDGGRWVFEQFGVAFDFENLDAYRARIKSKRFTSAMMEAYLNHFGISLHDKSFYTDPADETPSIMFEKVGGHFSEPR